MIVQIINWSIIGFLIVLIIRCDWRQTKNLRDEKELLFKAIDKDREYADKIYMKKEVFDEIEKRYMGQFKTINDQLKDIKSILDEIKKG